MLNLLKTDFFKNDFLLISLGAIVGANARYLISRLAARALGPVFPYGTLFINVSGSLIVGFFMVWASERVLIDPRWRLLIVVGFVEIDRHLDCHRVWHFTAPAPGPCPPVHHPGTANCCSRCW